MAKGNNQWTKLRDARSPEAKRAKQRWQERYQAGELMDELRAHYKGERELSATQIKAIELVLDRVAPKLSAVEQTTISDTDQMSEEELLGLAQALITSHPELISKLNLASKPVQVSANNTISPLNEVNKAS